MDTRRRLRKIGGKLLRAVKSSRALGGSGHDPESISPWVPLGHYYSPLPAPEALRTRAERIWAPGPAGLPGIDLGVEQQLRVLDALGRLQPGMAYDANTDWSTGSWRYHPNNNMFGLSSACALHLMLRHLRPKRIVEVGSGFSSAVMLDTSERFLDASVKMTFIEPYPERLYGLLRGRDRERCEIIVKNLQDVEQSVFSSLEANDVLFIDSSHVLKTDSDLCHLLFDVLPALPPGVQIQFHDVLYPFEYPEAWVYENRAWNEAYALRAFLQFNDSFRVRFWASYLFRHERAALEKVPALCSDGSSLWLERIAR